MTDTMSNAALDVLISQVSDMREDIREMRDDLKEVTNNKVSYREWSQRNTEVNGRFQSMGREIGDLRTELRAKSAPWWTICAMIVAIGSFAWSVFGPA